jgi:transcription elongation factor Elf1
MKNYICKNCGLRDSVHIRAMVRAGFEAHQIACRDCGQYTNVEIDKTNGKN